MIQKTDKKAFLSILVAAILITTIPYVLAIANQGDKWVFSGFFIGVEDGNSYLAKMLSGSVGEWVFRTPYTTFPQTGIFAFFPYILLGKLASPPALHIQLIILYQLFRWIGIFIYLLGTYKLLRLFISSDHCRTIALLLSAFGGGLGWLFPILGIKELAGTIPIDFYSPETFGFLSIYSLPHLSAARGLMFLALANHISVINCLPGTVGKSLYTGGILFIAGIFQPLNSAIGFILIIIVSISYLLLSKDHQSERRSIFKHAIFAAIPVIPLIAYYGIAQYTDPFYKAWTAQNIITSPNPVHYLLGFAVPILVIILNIRALARIRKL